MPLKQTSLDASSRQLLEKINNLEINQKVVSKDPNHDKIKEILDMGKQNATIYLHRKHLGEKLNIYEENNLFKILLILQKILNLSKVPRKIECYDISHLSGKFVYGSMIVFVDGKPQKKFYRLFKTKDQNNDFENHKEVLTRRFERSLEYYLTTKDSEKNEESAKKLDTAWELPDLIIVDGGKGQLSSDLEVVEIFKEKFKSLSLPFETEICALAKKEEEVFVPNSSVSYLLNSEAKFLIQRIRDEAHRFAITANREARIKSIKNTKLTKISGIGAKSEQKILSKFGSVENLLIILQQNPTLVYETLGKNLTEKLKKVS